MESKFQIDRSKAADPKSARRLRERASRREHLLESAERVFGQKPFHEATMQEVASFAGVGMQGLYEQFPSKQALYEELVLARGQACQARVDQALAGLRDPLDKLRAICHLRMELALRRPAFLPVFRRERLLYDWRLSSRSSERFREIYEQERERLKELLGEAVRRKKLREAPRAFLALFYQECVEAAQLYGVQHGSPDVVEACVELAMDAFLKGAGA